MLAIAVERDSPRPVYRQIEEQIRRAIRDGRLPPGTRLPSIRDLAGQLTVSRITVVTAYENLVSAGYLEARVGSGTRVAAHVRDGQLVPPVLRVVPHLSTLSRRERARRAELRPVGLSPELFDAEVWGQLLARSWRELAAERRGGTDWSWGDPYLRAALAKHLGVTRGVKADPESILILTSATAVCSTLSRSLLGPGSVAAVEDPGCPYFAMAIAASGARIFGVPSGPDGLALESLPPAADLVLLGPSWAYPLGGTMPMHRRRELIEWANRANAVILEHDWAGTVRFEGGPLPAVETLDAIGRACFVGGFFETMPAAPLGYAVIPRRLRARIEAALIWSDVSPSSVEQRALGHFLDEGHLDAHLRRLRLRLSGRRERLEQLGRSKLRDVGRLTFGPAGMQAILRLEDGTSAVELARHAQDRGVQVAALSAFGVSAPLTQALVIDYSSGSDEDLDRGVAVLRESWEAIRREPARRTSA